jgi:hypothetical protein
LSTRSRTRSRRTRLTCCCSTSPPDQDFETCARAPLAAAASTSRLGHRAHRVHQVERERPRAAGFTDRVDKPVDADKLIAGIRAASRTASPQRPTHQAQALLEPWT